MAGMTSTSTEDDCTKASDDATSGMSAWFRLRSQLSRIISGEASVADESGQQGAASTGNRQPRPSQDGGGCPWPLRRDARRGGGSGRIEKQVAAEIV
jgi:hypothetical protein